MREPSGAPAPAGVLFPELLATPEPAPPAQGRWVKLLKVLARALLWSLIAVGAVRGLMPAPSGPAPTRSTPAGLAPAVSAPAGSALARSAPGSVVAGSAPGSVVAGSVVAGSAGSSGHEAAEAVAAAFLREYLTVGEDRAARAQRLSQLSARGVELRRSVSLPAGVVQYADLVVPAGSRPVAGGVEVTVVAHVLHLRSDVYTDAGTLAFVVPLAVRREGVAVAGRPRPTTVPIASRLAIPRQAAVPASLAQLAGRVAHQAVVAFVTGDKAALARLGGGRAPSTRPLPSGWRTVSVGPAEVTGTAGELAAEVPVRARPPTGPASYSLPVRVQLEAGPQAVTVRQVDGGGSP
jgi:hypothetical protein